MLVGCRIKEKEKPRIIVVNFGFKHLGRVHGHLLQWEEHRRIRLDKRCNS